MSRRRRGHTHEEVAKAYNRRCHFTCRECATPCTAGRSDNHRFDCCGVVVAHVMGANLTTRIIDNPMSAGYLTGPSTTHPKGASLGRVRTSTTA